MCGTLFRKGGLSTEKKTGNTMAAGHQQSVIAMANQTRWPAPDVEPGSCACSRASGGALSLPHRRSATNSPKATNPTMRHPTLKRLIAHPLVPDIVIYRAGPLRLVILMSARSALLQYDKNYILSQIKSIDTFSLPNNTNYKIPSDTQPLAIGGPDQWMSAGPERCDDTSQYGGAASATKPENSHTEESRTRCSARHHPNP